MRFALADMRRPAGRSRRLAPSVQEAGPASRFGRWAPKVQRGPRRHRPYSLKGSVPEAPAYVSVRLCMDLGGGGGAQPRAPLWRSSVQGYAGSQWSEGSKNRQCIVCRKRLQGAADAPCTLETMPATGIPNTHTRTHTHARVRVYICLIHIYIKIYTHIYLYTYIHTYI